MQNDTAKNIENINEIKNQKYASIPKFQVNLVSLEWKKVDTKITIIILLKTVFDNLVPTFYKTITYKYLLLFSYSLTIFLNFTLKLLNNIIDKNSSI